MNHVKVLGKVTVKLKVDSVQRTVDCLVVPDHLQEVPILIGQAFTEQPGLLVSKDSKSLRFSELQLPDSNTPSKIALWLEEATVIPPNHVGNLRVISKSSLQGDFYIEACFRCQLGREYAIPRVLIHLSPEDVPVIPIINLSGKDLTLNNKDPIVRAFACKMEADGDQAAQILRLDITKLPLLKEEDVKIGTSDLQLRGKLMVILQEFRDLFGTVSEHFGQAKSAEMVINLTDHQPFTYRPYRMAEMEKEKVRTIVSELLGAGIVRESSSCYASPVLLVKKKDGHDRMCIDYRKLNLKTIKDRYPLPRIDDQIDKLSGCSVFTSLNLSSGYHQIPIAEQSKHLTSFVTPEGQYEYNRMPFGLSNAPAVFQRMMNQILGPYRDIAAVYLDDVILPSKNPEENLCSVHTIFQTLRNENLTLNINKCVFLCSTINYLGFEIDQYGVRPGAAKIEAVRYFPVPKAVKQVRQFLGLTGYFRKFVKNYSAIVKPLTTLTKKNIPWHWGAPETKAFEDLKSRLIERPILAIYDPTLATEIHTDASQDGIAGILLQYYESQLRPVAYYSRHTNKAERKYHSFELETLAVVETLLKFRVYLLGLSFKVITDCNALKTASSKRNLIPRIARWWLQL